MDLSNDDCLKSIVDSSVVRNLKKFTISIIQAKGHVKLFLAIVNNSQ